MKTKSLLVGALLLGAASVANAITVDGITWDIASPPSFPNTLFQFNFTQWYVTPANATPSTLNVAPTLGAAITASTIVVGDQLTGVASMYSANTTAISTPQLTLVFGVNVASIAAHAGGGVDIGFSSGGFANLYKDTTTNFNYLTVPSGGQSNVNNAADGSLWLSFIANNFAIPTYTGTGSVSGSAELIINGGSAQSAFNTNVFSSLTIPVTYDAQYNSSAFVDPNAKYSTGGNGQIRLDVKTIPEPAALSLFGIGLLGMFFAKRKAKV
jgi:hypothetical protein